MTVSRIFLTALVCLGLVVPSAHGIALCMDSDGNVSLEAAVNGSCVGAQRTSSTCGTAPAGGLGLQARSVDHCGSCRDVVLSADDAATPAPTDSKARRGAPGDNGIAFLAAVVRSTGDLQSGFSGSAPLRETFRGPPYDRTVVLRL